MGFDTTAFKTTLFKLVADIHAVHTAGSGVAQLADIAAAFGVPLDAAARQLLAQRGSVTFRATGAERGVFENRGSEARLPTDVAIVIIPPVIAGTYVSTADSLTLRFNEGQTLVGRKGLLSAPLESMSANRQQAAVRVGGFLGGLLSRTIPLT